VVSPSLNPLAGGPRLVGCPLLIIQYIRSYPAQLEAVSFMSNPKTRTHITWGSGVNEVQKDDVFKNDSFLLLSFFLRSLLYTLSLCYFGGRGHIGPLLAGLF